MLYSQHIPSRYIPEPGNREGCGRKDIRRKNTLGCLHGWLTLAVDCVAAAGQLVVIQLKSRSRLSKVVVNGTNRRVTRWCVSFTLSWSDGVNRGHLVGAPAPPCVNDEHGGHTGWSGQHGSGRCNLPLC